MEKLLHAESETTHRQILERFAEELPVTNRTIKGGNKVLKNMTLKSLY